MATLSYSQNKAESKIEILSNKENGESDIIRFHADQDGFAISGCLLERYGDESGSFSISLSPEEFQELIDRLNAIAKDKINTTGSGQ